MKLTKPVRLFKELSVLLEVVEKPKLLSQAEKLIKKLEKIVQGGVVNFYVLTDPSICGTKEHLQTPIQLTWSLQSFPRYMTDGEVEWDNEDEWIWRKVKNATFLISTDGSTNNVGITANASFEVVVTELEILLGKKLVSSSAILKAIEKKVPVVLTSNIISGNLAECYVEYTDGQVAVENIERVKFGYNPSYWGSKKDVIFKGATVALIHNYGSPSLNGSRRSYKTLYITHAANEEVLRNVLALLS